MKLEINDDFYLRVFRKVYAKYEEVKSTSGTLKPGGRGGFMGDCDSSHIRLCPSDFICDFEIASKRALEKSPSTFYRLFVDRYLNHSTDDELKVKHQLDDVGLESSLQIVQTRIGKRLFETEIYPMKAYFRNTFYELDPRDMVYYQ